jgi:hypothetical protein
MRSAAVAIAVCAIATLDIDNAWAGDKADCSTAISLTDGTPLGLATVVGWAPRVFFIKGAAEEKGCPAETDECRWRAFIVPGDRVLTAQRSDGFVCASFVSKKGLETAGWLPASALKDLPPPSPTVGIEAWVGAWQGNVEQQITIRRGSEKNMLSISGEATFGAFDPERIKRGSVNSGEIAADVAPQNGTLAFAMVGEATKPYDQGGEYDCRVRMRRFADYLFVEDNHVCGGANVSFTGAYRRK